MANAGKGGGREERVNGLGFDKKVPGFGNLGQELNV